MDNCWLCGRPLKPLDLEKKLPEEYMKNGNPPCESCLVHMEEVDFKSDEWD